MASAKRPMASAENQLAIVAKTRPSMAKAAIDVGDASGSGSTVSRERR